MIIPSEFLYIFIGSAFTLVVCIVSVLVSNNLLAPRRRQHFKKFDNAPIVIDPHYVVSVDLISVTSDVAVLTDTIPSDERERQTELRSRF